MESSSHSLTSPSNWDLYETGYMIHQDRRDGEDMSSNDEEKKAMVAFQGKNIRRTWQKGEWFFSVSDIIFILTDSKDELAYWRKLKQREPQLVTICHGLKMPAKDGKSRVTDCVNTENAFRLIQSIPSKKAEPFKRWLAKVGYERIQEIEDPELAQKRMKEIYRRKGYSDDWIEIFAENSLRLRFSAEV
jgi:DNA-damage-inducible protein D